jgi:hypothetical protein
MTFSIRTILIVMALVALWLGALVSKSSLAIELVSNFTALLILLTLPLAIWDPRPGMRPFWTGFFVLAVGNHLLSNYFAHQRLNHYFAELISGESVSHGTTTVAWDATILMRGHSSCPI